MYIVKLLKPIKKRGTTSGISPEIEKQVEINKNDIATKLDTSTYESDKPTFATKNELENCAKLDSSNTYTIDGPFIKTNRQNYKVIQFNNTNQKWYDIDFGWLGNGYRNWNYVRLMSQETVLAQFYFKEARSGLWIGVEQDKISFDRPTTINNVATPINDNQAVNKSYVDKSIANISGGNIFYEGEIKMFNSKAKADLFIQKHNLKLNVDYQLIQSSKYILTGDNGIVGGSNLIKQSDLPNISGNIDVPTYNVNGCFTKQGSFKFGAGNSNNNYSGVSFKLNNGVEQTQFKPEYIEVYMIVFLKDIRL